MLEKGNFSSNKKTPRRCRKSQTGGSPPSPACEMKCCRALLFCAAFAQAAHGSFAEIFTADVCVYDGTAGGVIAAVETARLGKSVVLTEFGSHLGGMTSGGLSQ